MLESNYEALAEAIVVQAARDYLKALCMVHKYQSEIEEVERFFNGSDMEIYSKIDGSELLKILKDRAADNNYDLKKIRENAEKEIDQEE